MGVRFLPRPRERRSSPTGGPGPGSGSCRWARGWEFHSNSREKLGGVLRAAVPRRSRRAASHVWGACEAGVHCAQGACEAGVHRAHT